ncbi:MAG: hypothetical protein N2039_12305 [Gemmataceae bacterium]|nr:hypothetical protein [Gemmataceae bacterium]
MAWFVGIDEAGYGPNLGPLVQSAVAVNCDSPPDDLPKRLSQFLRRRGDTEDGRILIDDSKTVHSGPRGFQRLESSILGTIPPDLATHPSKWRDWLCHVAADSFREVAEEPWFAGGLTLPVETTDALVAESRQRLQTARRHHGPILLWASSVVTTAAELNRLLARGLNKSQVLEEGLRRLFRTCQRHLGDSDEIYFVIDCQGGRRYYADFLSDVFPGRWIHALREDKQGSRYRCLREPMVEWAFQVQAEASHWLVAWASMLSKYIREVSMRQFNAFWQNRLPHLRSTAGYPVDARRFLKEIDGLRRQLNIPIESIWRRK